MVQFNKLEITKDEKYLIIDVLIPNENIYENIYIDSIYVYDLNNYSNLGPGDKYVACFIPETDEKHIVKYVDIDGLSDRMFFIQVTIKGEFTEDAPCTTTRTTSMGVVYNESLLLQKILKYVNAFACCEINMDFVNFILLKEALDINLKMLLYDNAIDIWKRFKNITQKEIKSCGCGKY